MLESLEGSLRGVLGTPSLLALAAAYAGGVLASFTPCIYPLIPITVSYIGAQQNQGRLTGFLLSVAYVAGTAIVYTALGCAAGITGSLFGSLQTNAWVNLAAGNVFILMGLSMLDVFILPLPGFMRSQLFSPKSSGLPGAFLLGIASGFIMSPCSAPILAVLLGYVATKQTLIMGIFLLLAFSFGMGTLLIILGTFTGVLKSLPRSGPWLQKVQKAFGVVFLAMGEYFLVQAGMYFV